MFSFVSIPRLCKEDPKLPKREIKEPLETTVEVD
jgi:hypothetical protein